MNKSRFLQLLESELGDVKPLIDEKKPPVDYLEIGRVIKCAWDNKMSIPSACKGDFQLSTWSYKLPEPIKCFIAFKAEHAKKSQRTAAFEKCVKDSTGKTYDQLLEKYLGKGEEPTNKVSGYEDTESDFKKWCTENGYKFMKWDGKWYLNKEGTGVRATYDSNKKTFK